MKATEMTKPRFTRILCQRSKNFKGKRRNENIINWMAVERVRYLNKKRQKKVIIVDLQYFPDKYSNELL